MGRKKVKLSDSELRAKEIKLDLKARKVRTKFIISKIRQELAEGKVIKGLRKVSSAKTIYKEVCLGTSQAHKRFNFLFKCFYIGAEPVEKF